MPNTALNRTTQVLLTNKSGGNLAYGDVVVLDNTNTNGFTTTTTAGLSTRGLGVILEPSGIANNASGMVAVGGWCPKVNLNTAAAIGQFVKTHTVAGQGTPHASPQVEGDFAVALAASATPPCNLFGSPNGPLAGGSGTVTNTGTLTSGKTILGNGTTDVTVSSLTAQFVGSSSGTEAAASMTTARLLGRTTASSGAVEEITVGSGLTLSAGSLTASGGGLVLVEQHTGAGGSTPALSFTSLFTSTYNNYFFVFENVLPASNNVTFLAEMSTDGGSTWVTTNYRWTRTYNGDNGIGGNSGSGSASYFEITDGVTSTAANGGVCGEWKAFHPLSTVVYKAITGSVTIRNNSGTYYMQITTGWQADATAMTAVRFRFSSGDVASGTIYGYGYAK